MSSNTSDVDGLMSSFIPHKSEQDGLLSTASIGIIIGCIVLIGIAPTLSLPVRVSLSISIGCLTIGMFLLLWYNPRLEIRNEKMKSFLNKRIEKTKEDMRSFVRTYEMPLYEHAFMDTFQKLTKKSNIKTKEEYQEVIDKSVESMKAVSESISSKDDIPLRLFYKDLIADLRFWDEKIYHKPLEESNGKLKCYLDIFFV